MRTCEKCTYDLSASAEFARCPECGMPCEPAPARSPELRPYARAVFFGTVGFAFIAPVWPIVRIWPAGLPKHDVVPLPWVLWEFVLRLCLGQGHGAEPVLLPIAMLLVLTATVGVVVGFAGGAVLWMIHMAIRAIRT